jgi:uncharacterized protein YlaN (UPF0358 family)
LLGVIKLFVYAMAFLAIIFGLAVVFTDGKILKKGSKDNSKKNSNKKSEDASKTNKKSSKEGEIKIGYTQDFLDFEDIEIFSKDNPMGLIVKGNKNEFVGIVEVFGINYNLLSVEERLNLEESFGKLLNGIDYAIQIYVQSRKLDIEKYEHKYDTRLEEIKQNINSLSTRLKFLKENNEDKEKLSELEKKISNLMGQYEYGIEVKEYMMARSKQKNILDRKYYIILSYKHNSSMFEEKLTYEEILSNAFSDVANKSHSLINALTRSKLGGKILNGIELAEVLYSAYNKQDSSVYKMSNALKSQFNHLYTTSTPVEVKKIARQIEEIEIEEKKEYKKLETLAVILNEEKYGDFNIENSDIELETNEIKKQSSDDMHVN